MKNGNLKTAQRAISEYRTLLLQDYLSMEIKNRYIDDSWKTDLYEFYQAGQDGQHPDQYSVPFAIMQAKGLELYSVTEMDTTVLISVIGFSTLSEELRIGEGTVEVLKILQQERNAASHPSENEPAEDIYTYGVNSLNHLKEFVERSYEESKILTEDLDLYKQKHLSKIQELQDELQTAFRKDTQSEEGLSTHNSWTRMLLRKPVDCPKCRDVKTMVLNQNRTMYRCINCGFTMSKQERLKDILWFCDGCDTFLNSQPGFKEHGETWICTVCGYNNDVTSENVF